MPSFSALNVNCDWWPGAVKLEAAPPPGPVTPCRSMLCGILLSWWFSRWNSTVSPWRTRMKLPGTVPPKVQNVYFTPAAISRSTSRTSSLTMTLAGAWRPVGGGTRGGLVSTAFTGSPCGGPKSPCREPPVSAETCLGACCPQATSSVVTMPINHLFILSTPEGITREKLSRPSRDGMLIQVNRGVDKHEAASAVQRIRGGPYRQAAGF